MPRDDHTSKAKAIDSALAKGVDFSQREASDRTAPNIFLPETRTDGRPYLHSATKRLLDFILSAAALLVLIPLMAVMAVLIKVTSAGPVMYRQRRHGINMRTFTIYKFRTMYVSSPLDSFQQATRLDRRVTLVGRLFRRTSLDELPQFFNVLLGDMSIVGPRPHPIDLDNKYSTMIPEYHTRFMARPGITGLAQVNGARGETPTVDYMQRRVSWDAIYVKRASFGLDLSILIGTLRELIASKTAF